MTHTAYIALGSNLGDRIANLREAIRRLGELGEVTRVSSWYETEPVEVTEQPWFVNAAVELRTKMAPMEVLRGLLEIESAMGRERIQAKGPRNIDLDLLLLDNEMVNTSELTLPHPALHLRRFVLAPLAEIAPDAMHPTLRKPALTLLEMLPKGATVRRIAAAKE
jgi:2-amino-4-hydroxy-6-hydroxymethyldihydropteridine diphosphokinase